MSLDQLETISKELTPSFEPQQTLPQRQAVLELCERIENEFTSNSETRHWPIHQSRRSFWGIIDRGCGNGQNSGMFFRAFKNAIRKHSDSPIQAICNERDSSKLNDLAVRNARERHFQNKLGVFRSMICGSFLDQLLPTGTVDLVCSNMAVHWLDLEHPTVGVSSLGGALLPGLVSRMAEVQWNRLLASVDCELRTGGKFIVSFVVRPPDGQMHLPLRLLSDAVNTVLNAPSFDQHFCFTAAVPVYLRSREEVLYPFTVCETSGLRLHVDSYEELPIYCPYFEQFRLTANADELAKQYSDHIRAFSEASIRCWLTKSGFSSATSSIIEEIYSEIRHQIRRDPEQIPMNRHVGILAVTKK